jgi:hypothetical protein
MTSDIEYEVDLDQGTIRFENEWLGRQQLADKIKSMIESQNYSISNAGQALEFLERTLSDVRTFKVKLSAADATRVEQHAQRSGIALAAFVRQAVQAYLAAQPPLAEDDKPAVPGPVPISGPSEDLAAAVDASSTKPVVTTITTEPAGPGEEASAVELTDKKSGDGSKVVIAPVLQAEFEKQGPSVVGDGWFKKT